MAHSDDPQRNRETSTPTDDLTGGDEKHTATDEELAAYEEDIEADQDDVEVAVEDLSAGDDTPPAQAQQEQDRQLESGEENPV